MKIPCVLCQFICELDSTLVKPTGSLVRCPECDFIFMVQRPSIIEEPIAKDTNIDQSILNDLYSIRPKPFAELPVDEPIEEFDDYEVPSLTSIENIGEEAMEEPDSNTEDISFANLPDLSEYDDMIDVKDNTYREESSSTKQQNNNSRVYPI